MRCLLPLLLFLGACSTNEPPPSVAEVRCLDRAHTAAAADFREYAEAAQQQGYVSELSQSNYTDVYDRDCR